MILTEQTDNSYFVWIDIGRPYWDTEETLEIWQKFHIELINSEIQFIPNSVFWGVLADLGIVLNHGSASLVNQPKIYYGGGYTYRFWFKDHDNCTQFEQFINKFKIYGYSCGERTADIIRENNKVCIKYIITQASLRPTQ